jgi:hypothetical protein
LNVNVNEIILLVVPLSSLYAIDYSTYQYHSIKKEEEAHDIENTNKIYGR